MVGRKIFNIIVIGNVPLVCTGNSSLLKLLHILPWVILTKASEGGIILVLYLQRKYIESYSELKKLMGRAST